MVGVFTDDKHFVYADRYEIKVLSLGSGDTVSVLRGHKANVTSLSVSPWNFLHLISCDAEGCIKVWDYKEATCLKTFENANIEKLCGQYGILRGSKFDVKNGGLSTDWKLVRVDMSGEGIKMVSRYQSEGESKASQRFIKSKGGICREIKVGGKENKLVATVSKQTIALQDMSTGEIHRLVYEKPMKSVAIHPNEDIVVGGSVEGQIVAFRKNNGSFKNPIVSVWHWHSQSVESVAFTTDGSHFISGGHEGVLVVWQVDTGHKTFLPRLGGGIGQVATSPDGSKYGVVMKSNLIRIFDSRTRQQVLEVQCLGGRGAKTNFFVCEKNVGAETTTNGAEKKINANYRIKLQALRNYGTVFEPRTGCLVVQKSPGVLQFFDLNKDREVASLNVSMRNIVSRTERDEKVLPTFVDLVAFSPGRTKRLVTVDRRLKKTALKFWRLDTSDVKASGGFGKFVETTHVEQPHSKPIVALLFHPSGELVISASRDKSFKVWELKRGTGQWNCRSVGYFRNSPIGSAALSQDGSVLAVSYDNMISLWNPLKNTMLHVLTQPTKPGRKITQMRFFRQNLLATTSSDGTLFVWDILKTSVVWSLKLGQISAIGSSKNELLVVVGGKKLVVFKTESAVPSLIMDVANKDEYEMITGVGFSERLNTYVYTTETGAVRRFEDEDLESTKELADAETKQAETTYALLTMNNKSAGKTGKRKIDDDVELLSASSSTLKLLDAYPSHALPPMSKLLKCILNGKEEQAAKRTRLEKPDGSNNKKPQLALENGVTTSEHSDSTMQESPDDQEYKSIGKLQDKAIEVDMTAFFHKSLFKK
uniref:WD repeat-containing protein 75 second beta-propeller domain-containing protein n=1 Tax=Mucochytrium quahogii TaxID=96639 RepID=A0A7S2SPP9_9STRA|mmetsp:Transcript_16214/g.27950  ORF Transcript_16214/g.27950 Transcript_16214/m.27950 type:complete len:819 (+) Transcript_16214:224-2680(+)|eukprot:CAMPEP_0203747248 /NCGR_PEP_ID=MMETSP0098-20131031/2438_1 /ASSEMBLY_ACC=CAM_ASM_000208 /TAXON_ID=96639 /ORGANISM=" , Strain NY0313808BC1" /LENGTH=818 /DNA_ID=CAMNT_0050635613 /DNA_START=240 /DNA_END=2696 /DNA_ORIENTATION=+